MSSQTIQIKRRNSGSAGAPATLAAGELAYNAIDNILYFGAGDNGSGVATSIIKLAGAGAYILGSLLGVASGVATLDGTGKLTAAQIPASITGAMVYQGTWNAATNSPSLVSGTGTKGQFYKVSTSGVVTATTASAAATSGATTVSVASTTGIAVGNLFSSNAAAPAGTIVTAISGTNVTLSNALTSAITSGAGLLFSSYLDGTTGAQFQIGDIVAFDGTAWDKIDGPAEAVTSVAGRIGAVVLSSADITDATSIGKSLLTIASLAAARALFKIDSRTNINDASYQALSTDYNVQYTAISAARTLTLAPAASFNPGAEIQIGDGSGNCSSSIAITVTASGSDTINGSANYVISAAYGQVTLQSNGTNGWTLVCQTAPVATNVNGGTY